MLEEGQLVDFIFGYVVETLFLFTAILTAYLTYYSVKLAKNKSERVFNYSNDIIKYSKGRYKNNFQLEQAFQEHFGSRLEASIIHFFLTLNDPSEVIENFIKGRFYLQEKKDDKGKVCGIKLKRNLDIRNKFYTEKFLSLLIPAFFTFGALLFFLASLENMKIDGLAPFNITLLISSFPLGWISYKLMVDFAKIDNAREVIRLLYGEEAIRKKNYENTK